MKFCIIYRLVFVVFLFFCSLFVDAEKVLILTYSFNRPDFIEWQYKTFEKFLLDDYEFVVFNDAQNSVVSRQIEAMCDRYGIACVRVPQNHPNNTPGGRHQVSIRYSLDSRGFNHTGIVCMIDSDMFLVKHFSIVNFMKNYDIAGWGQFRPNNVYYLFPGLVFMDMSRLPNKETMNWAGGNINGSAVDTGGQIHYYLKYNPNVRLYKMDSIIFCANATVAEIASWDQLVENTVWLKAVGNNEWINHIGSIYTSEDLKNYGLNNYAIKFAESGFPGSCQFLLGCNFFHYRAASWDFSIDHSKKTALVNQYIHDILAT